MKRKVLISLGVLIVIAVSGGIFLHTGTEDNSMGSVEAVEALELITKTYMSMPSVHGLAKGSGDGTVVDVDGTNVDEDVADMIDLYAGSVVETETPEDEDYIQSLGEQDVVDTAVNPLNKVMYATQNVNLRKHTAVTSESIRVVNFNEEVKVIGITVDKQWYMVEDAQTESVGFIASNYLSSQKNETNSSTIQAEDPTITPDASKAELPEQPETPTQSSETGTYESYKNSSAYAELDAESQAALDAIAAQMASHGTGSGEGHGGYDASGLSGGHHLNGN